MSIGKSLSGWFASRRRPKASGADPWGAPSPGLVNASSVQIGRHHWVFGLEWQVYDERKELSRLQRTHQAQGYTHCVLASAGHMVGFAAGIDKSLGRKPLSVAVHLAETVSLGNLELFIFELPDGLFSLTALNDSQPVPHFDHVGTLQETLALISEYRALQSDQPIRYVGNTDMFDSIEKMTLNEAFARPEGSAQLSKLPNYRLRKTIAMIVLPSVLALAAGAAWLEHMRQVEEQERIAREQDPNYIYENAVGSAMQQTGLQAQITLDRWREVIFRIPTARAGWRLEKITCQPTSCSVSWARDFGSYQDFHAQPLDGANSSSEVQNGDSPAKANITTVMSVPTLPNESKGLVRNDLPPSRDILQQVASQLQDISLLPEANVKLKQPELYPNTGATVEQIANPVVKGEWTITHELWSLGDLSFNLPTLVLQSLTIEQDEKTKNWTYSLTGHFYAKGKNN
jgi:hypothetical protein